MKSSRRDFIRSAAAAAAVAGWYRPAWSATPVRAPAPVHGIRTIENEWIPMPDGVRLAARIFMPEGALEAPVGAVLEYLPYSKRKGYRRVDDRTASWLVPRGFALVRVDVRGTGESGGIIQNEYDLPEQADAAPLIRWISRQPWCNGKVGMRGISYGSINSFQAAAKGIPELQAIVASMGTENGYTDDVHTLGGCVINEKVVWGTIWKQIMISPPDPELVGERWREIWLERLRAQVPLVSEWMRHQLVDQYWRDRILTDYSKVKCAVYVIGGQTDSYINTVPRTLERLSCPRKGIVGPWGHDWPNEGDPGPSIDWAVEESRWWDYWLNGNDNGIMSEPMLRTYVADGMVRQHHPNDIPGRWVAEERWPSPSIQTRRLYASPGNALQASAPAPARLAVPGELAIGTAIPLLSPIDMAQQAPTEQSVDDRLSLVFESAPLESDIDIVGRPVLRLSFVADKPIAKLAVRLNEVAPDGRSWLLTYGARNLAHNSDHTAYVPIVPGREQAQDVPLNYISRRVRKGWRLRLSISQSQWPIVWPVPEAVALQLVAGPTAIDIPVRPTPSRELPMPIRTLGDDKKPAANPGHDGFEPIVKFEGPAGSRRASFASASPLELSPLAAIRMRIGSGLSVEASIREDEVNSYRIAFTSENAAERDGWKAAAKVATTMTSTPTHFVVEESIEAWHDGEKIHEARWSNRIRRDGN
ncbi:MAG: CocE/NonD family hydrolase [Steroidobacteraceae bacterium]|jgi:putative CocE/NonD family hydrolase|nr:CocE/NonD family hydrolase [Steroidobacteraceae bacterium]